VVVSPFGLVSFEPRSRDSSEIQIESNQIITLAFEFIHPSSSLFVTFTQKRTRNFHNVVVAASLSRSRVRVV